jgi:exopolysaccharide biosynthesis polyprenyl glycosylphosphotransferase
MRHHGRHAVVGHLTWPDESDRDLALLERSYAVDNSACKVLGAATQIEETLRKVAVSEVYIAGNVRKSGSEMQDVIRVCEKFGMPFALPAYSFRLERAQAVDPKPISDGYLHYHSTESKPHQMALKRLFDIISSAVALWLLLPLFGVVMALIKLTSRGPIFFKQERVGQHGRAFHMLKFRSMVINAEELKAKLAEQNEQTGPVFKMKNDPRVTGIGRFIRKYSIDELPQLINVLRGDMSVVGPRPPVPREVEKYEAWQRRRLSVRPGLTCIWQVSGRNQITFEQWMYLDMQYIDHWSLAQDFSLIFKTFPVVITGRGAS